MLALGSGALGADVPGPAYPIPNLSKESKYAGKVVDADGKPVEGAKAAVYLWNFSGGKSKMELACETRTDSQGKFSVAANLPEEGRGRVLATVLVSKEGLALGWAELESRTAGDVSITLDKPNLLGGTVVDESGAPVAGAQVGLMMLITTGGRHSAVVGLRPIDALVTKTDASGRFIFKAVPASAMAEFLVSAPGRVSIWTFAGAGDPGQFAPGREDVKITLPKEAVVEGTVVDKVTGKAVPGVEVTAVGRNYGNRFFDATAVSGPDGTFRIANLPPGEPSVQIVESRDKPADWIAAQVKVTLEAGKTDRGVKIELEKGAVLEVSVTDAATGKPVENANVYARVQSGQRGVGGVSGADGVFRGRTLPGKYVGLQVIRQGFDNFNSTEEIILADGETKHIDVALKGQAKLTGVAVDEAGKGVAGVSVRVAGGGWGDEVRTDDNGKFETPYTRQPGEEGRPIYLIVRQVQRNLGAVVPVDDETKPVEVRMAPGRTLKGRVIDTSGKPIPGAVGYVMVRVERYGLNIGDRLTTSKDGSYEVKAVPGDNVYDVSSNAKGYGENSATVDTEDSKDGVCAVPDIVLGIADKSVAGVVVDKDGKAVANAYVSAYGGGQKHNQTNTDKDGKFRIGDLAEGKVNVSAQVSGGQLWGYVTAQAGNENVKIVLRERETTEEPAQPKEPQRLAGKRLPDLKALGADKAWTAAVDGAAGKVVLVVFHDSGQRPSRQAMSALGQRAKTLEAKGIAVLLIDVGGKPAVSEAGKSAVAFPATTLGEKAEETKFAWGVKALPWLIITDKKHVVRAEGFGIDQVDAKIAEILAQ